MRTDLSRLAATAIIAAFARSVSAANAQHHCGDEYHGRDFHGRDFNRSHQRSAGFGEVAIGNTAGTTTPSRGGVSLVAAGISPPSRSLRFPTYVPPAMIVQQPPP